jgi:hypothetical protein
MKLLRMQIGAASLLFLIGAAGWCSAGDTASERLKQAYRRPDTIPFPDAAPYSPQMATLGKMLFFDPRLSGAQNLSCASCHNPSFGYEVPVPGAIGAANTHRGVDLVAETGKTLDRIIGRVSEINDVVSAIATSAEEQSTELQQVSTAAHQMEEATQHSAAMVQETASATHALANETEALGRLIGRFQIGPSTVAATGSRPPQRASVARPALKTMALRGSPAAVRKPAIEEAEWEEF